MADSSEQEDFDLEHQQTPGGQQEEQHMDDGNNTNNGNTNGTLLNGSNSSMDINISNDNNNSLNNNAGNTNSISNSINNNIGMNGNGGGIGDGSNGSGDAGGDSGNIAGAPGASGGAAGPNSGSDARAPGSSGNGGSGGPIIPDPNFSSIPKIPLHFANNGPLPSLPPHNQLSNNNNNNINTGSNTNSNIVNNNHNINNSNHNINNINMNLNNNNNHLSRNVPSTISNNNINNNGQSTQLNNQLMNQFGNFNNNNNANINNNNNRNTDFSAQFVTIDNGNNNNNNARNGNTDSNVLALSDEAILAQYNKLLNNFCQNVTLSGISFIFWFGITISPAQFNRFKVKLEELYKTDLNGFNINENIELLDYICNKREAIGPALQQAKAPITSSAVSLYFQPRLAYQSGSNINKINNNNTDSIYTNNNNNNNNTNNTHNTQTTHSTTSTSNHGNTGRRIVNQLGQPLADNTQKRLFVLVNIVSRHAGTIVQFIRSSQPPADNASFIGACHSYDTFQAQMKAFCKIHNISMAQLPEMNGMVSVAAFVKNQCMAAGKDAKHYILAVHNHTNNINNNSNNDGNNNATNNANNNGINNNNNNNNIYPSGNINNLNGSRRGTPHTVGNNNTIYNNNNNVNHTGFAANAGALGNPGLALTPQSSLIRSGSEFIQSKMTFDEIKNQLLKAVTLPDHSLSQSQFTNLNKQLIDIQRAQDVFMQRNGYLSVQQTIEAIEKNNDLPLNISNRWKDDRLNNYNNNNGTPYYTNDNGSRQRLNNDFNINNTSTNGNFAGYNNNNNSSNSNFNNNNNNYMVNTGNFNNNNNGSSMTGTNPPTFAPTSSNINASNTATSNQAQEFDRRIAQANVVSHPINCGNSTPATFTDTTNNASPTLTRLRRARTSSNNTNNAPTAPNNADNQANAMLDDPTVPPEQIQAYLATLRDSAPHAGYHLPTTRNPQAPTNTFAPNTSNSAPTNTFAPNASNSAPTNTFAPNTSNSAPTNATNAPTHSSSNAPTHSSSNVQTHSSSNAPTATFTNAPNNTYTNANASTNAPNNTSINTPITTSSNATSATSNNASFNINSIGTNSIGTNSNWYLTKKQELKDLTNDELLALRQAFTDFDNFYFGGRISELNNDMLLSTSGNLTIKTGSKKFGFNEAGWAFIFGLKLIIIQEGDLKYLGFIKPECDAHGRITKIPPYPTHNLAWFFGAINNWCLVIIAEGSLAIQCLVRKALYHTTAMYYKQQIDGWILQRMCEGKAMGPIITIVIDGVNRVNCVRMLHQYLTEVDPNMLAKIPNVSLNRYRTDIIGPLRFSNASGCVGEKHIQHLYKDQQSVFYNTIKGHSSLGPTHSSSKANNNYNKSHNNRYPRSNFNHSSNTHTPRSNNYNNNNHNHNHSNNNNHHSFKNKFNSPYKSDFSGATIFITGKPNAPIRKEFYNPNVHLPFVENLTQCPTNLCPAWQDDACFMGKFNCKLWHHCMYCGGKHPGSECRRGRK